MNTMGAFCRLRKQKTCLMGKARKGKQNMNNELTVKKNLQLPVVEINLDELKALAEKKAAEYTSVAITADSYKAAKADAKILAGYASDIDEARKEIKKQLEEPIKKFEADCKDVKKILDDAKAEILKQTEVFDEKRRAEKQKKAEAARDELISRYGLNAKYAALLTLKPEYMNLSGTDKSVKQDLNDRAYELKKNQDNEEKIYQEAEATINAVNDTLEQKYSMDDLEIKNLIESALIDTVKGAAWLSANIRERAASRKKCEDAIKEKAKAEAIKKAEAEKLREQTERKSDIQTVSMSAHDTPSADNSNNTDTVEIIDIDDIDDEIDVPAATVAEPTWLMAVELIGQTSKLAEVGNELKKLCARLGVSYTVDKSRSRVIKDEERKNGLSA